MNIWVRLSIVVTLLWLVAVAALVAHDFLNLMPGQCVFGSDPATRVYSFKGWFVSCNMFSDIPGTWWGSATIRRGAQVVEISTYRLFYAAVVPVCAVWVLLAGLPMGVRWAFKGSRRGT